MSGFALPGEMEVERGRGRIEEQPRWRKQTVLRDEPLQWFIFPNWATVLAVIGTGIVRWLSAAVRLLRGIRCHGSEIRRGSRRDRVATDSGSGWFGNGLSGVGPLDCRNSSQSAAVFLGGRGCRLCDYRGGDSRRRFASKFGSVQNQLLIEGRMGNEVRSLIRGRPNRWSTDRMGHCDSASCGKNHPGRLESSQPRPPAKIRRGSRRDRVATDSGGGEWFGNGLSGLGPLDCRNCSRTAAAFFVGADGVSVQAAAQGLGVGANRQTLRNRELGQLGQTQMWLKRYKTGMFANLANLANVFSQNRPAADPARRLARPIVRSHAPYWSADSMLVERNIIQPFNELSCRGTHSRSRHQVSAADNRPALPGRQPLREFSSAGHSSSHSVSVQRESFRPDRERPPPAFHDQSGMLIPGRRVVVAGG